MDKIGSVQQTALEGFQRNLRELNKAAHEIATAPVLTVSPQIEPCGMWGFLVFSPQGDPRMKRKRYTEEKIVSILKEHEAGASVPDLSRRYGIAENTIYRWKSKFGGMEVSEAKKLRELQDQNRRLKHLLAEAELDKAALKELVEGKW
jgi:putative transposase